MVGAALVRRLGSEKCTILMAARCELDLTHQEPFERGMEAQRPEAVFVAAAKVGGILANSCTTTSSSKQISFTPPIEPGPGSFLPELASLAKLVEPLELPMIIPVILAGGSGSRLWPLSRAQHSKAVPRACEREPLLADTARRVPSSPLYAPPLVITNEQNRFGVAAAFKNAKLPL